MKNLSKLSLAFIFLVFCSCSSENKAAQNADTASKTTETAQTVNSQNSNPTNVNPSEQASTDEELIKKYIADNNLKAERDPSGLYYVIEEAGSAEKPGQQDFIIAHYHGMLLDGTVFDSSVDRGEPFEFPLGRVIPGWQTGIPKFGKGGKGKLIIPSTMAYGPRNAGQIPPNSCLVFNVEVIDFLNQAEQAERQAEQAKIQAKLSEKQLAIDEEVIKKYIADKGLKAERDPSGVYYVVEEAGSAEKPGLQNEVTVHYHGTLTDGTIFDSSVDRGQPATFPLNGVVPGWQVGIPKFGKGGKGKLIIPSTLAYGSRPAGKIPPNSCLIFDVEVIDFK